VLSTRLIQPSHACPDSGLTIRSIGKHVPFPPFGICHWASPVCPDAIHRLFALIATYTLLGTIFVVGPRYARWIIQSRFAESVKPFVRQTI